MNILFLFRSAVEGIGGVEKHVQNISKILQKKGHKVTIVSTKTNSEIKNTAELQEIKIIRFGQPEIKYLGLLYTWFWLLKNVRLIKKADIIHIHDVFIWYLPFRFIFPGKKVFTTFHGWDEKYPIPLKNKIYTKIAAKLSNGTIAVGDFIGKWYGIKPSYVVYGAVSKKKSNSTKEQKNLKKKKKTIVWLGRLDISSDLPSFLDWLKANSEKFKIIFVGEGELRKECEKFGEVTGFVSDPFPYLRKADVVVPVGYLSYLEAKALGKEILTFAANPVKNDYWEGIKMLKSIPTWDAVAGVYEHLWKEGY